MTTPADAQPASFVETMPARFRPFLRLSRFDRPVGFWLLALPCFAGQALGRAGVGFSVYDLMLAALWVVGAVAMRGAGCTFNDIVDRDIDAQVERTRGRPIPAGDVSVRQAASWLAAQLAAGFGVWLCLPDAAKIVSLCAIPLVAAYPFMKRITWWPQAWLGLTFNWGVLVGFAAVTGTVGLPALLLLAACACWTIAYDTIYALQDREDDAMIGVRSTARLFGDRAAERIGQFYVAAVALAATACGLAAGWAAFAAAPGLAAFGWALLRQRQALDAGADPLTLFRSNREAGLVLVVALICQAAAGWVFDALG